MNQRVVGQGGHMLLPTLEKHCFEASPSQGAAQWPLQIGSIQLSRGQGKGSLLASRISPGTNTPPPSILGIIEGIEP